MDSKIKADKLCSIFKEHRTRQQSEVRVLFIGSGEFAATILKKIMYSNLRPIAIITQPSKLAGRHQVISPTSVKKIAEKYNINVYEPKDLKDEKTEKLINLLKPDLIIVTDYGKIIPKNILDVPRFNSVNIHPSLLPKYRGPSPIQYTILNGEKETGVTIILMDEKVDHGPILANYKLQITNYKITYTELLKNLAELGGDLLIKIIPQWLAGEIKPTPQDDSRAIYTKILTRKDGKINWHKSAEEIERQIRAFEKWPGSWSEWSVDNKKFRLKILKARILHQTVGCAENQTPGFVFLTEQKEMAINCNPGSLIMEELQLEGRKKMTSGEFLRGYPKIIGSVLM